jgi:glutamate synthase (NADPH/NADH) small chain
MTDPRAFLQIRRRVAPYRPADQRLSDHRDVGVAVDPTLAREQARRCMDCGVPFCQNGCPLHNVIPDWNDLVERGHWQRALEALHATNNFPEFTGKLCPAPCEEACVLALEEEPVTIKQVEMAIIERGFNEGWVNPQVAAGSTGRRVAVIGSGPAGLAAAQQLTRRGHQVTVFERDRLPGGLLRYGIPDFKLEKALIDRRLEQMVAEGTRFETGVDVGRDLDPARLGADHDAIVLATGAQRHRELDLPGRGLLGVEPALRYLTGRNRDLSGERRGGAISAHERRVIILGGGDTSADCLGNALREGASSVDEIAHGATPPRTREPLRTWPQWPALLRSYAVHEEGGERRWELEPIAFEGSDGHVTGVRVVPMRFTGRGGAPRPAGDPVTLPADLVLLAVGFDGVERDPLYEALGVRPTTRGTIPAAAGPAVFAAGDCVRGADLIVTAIADGRDVAERVDRHLSALGAANAA